MTRRIFSSKRIFLSFTSVISILLISYTTKNQIAFNIHLLSGCQCTDYVYSQRTDLSRGMGNANQWISSAAKRGYSYDQTPQVGDVAVFLNGSHGFSPAYGHVAMVTWVSDDHAQYNISGWDGLRADCILQSYSNLSVRSDDWFIHQAGSNPSQPPAPSAPAASTGGIEFNPAPPVRVGEDVGITVRLQPGGDYRAARLLIDYQVVSESSATEFSYTWNTGGFDPSVHNVRLEIASRDDTSWAHPYSYETTYLLREAVSQPNRSPNTPSPVSPTDGQTVDKNPTLCWHNKGDPDGNPVKTRTEVWGNGSWTSPWLEGDNPCWTLPAISSGQYSWSVRARDDKGAESSATSSSVLTFNYGVNNPSVTFDPTDPTSIATAINADLISRTNSTLESLISNETIISAYGGQGTDQRGLWSCPVEGFEPYCHLSPADFLLEWPLHLEGSVSCAFYASDDWIFLELSGFTPPWVYPNGDSSILQLDFYRASTEHADSPFELVHVSVEPMVGPGLADRYCP